MSLIVEDGTGLSTAESYISVADATAYFAAYGGADAFSSLDDAEVALRKASRDLDMLYGASYSSTALTKTQALLFPRVTFTDTNGRTVTGLPKVVGQAAAELALINVTSDSTGAADTSGNLKMSLLRADTLIKHTENFAPTSAAAVARRKVSLLMAPYLDAGSSGLYARITRG